MKKLLLIILLSLILSPAIAQQTIRFNNSEALSVSIYWKTKDSLYFKTTSPDKPYVIPLSQLKDYPSTTPELKSDNPDWYIMQFRRKQLTGIWINLLGAAIASAGAIITKDKVSPLVYGGIGICVIGFGFHIGSYYDLEKYYVVKSATPYIVKN